MPTVDVVDLNRRKVGSVELPAEVFGCKPHATLVHEAVVMQQACERQGTASTLRRGEVTRIREEALEAEAHGTGSRRFRSVAGMASWRIGVRSEAEELCLQHAEEEISGCAAKRLVSESDRRAVVRRLNPVPRTAQDEGTGQGAWRSSPQERRFWSLPARSGRA